MLIGMDNHAAQRTPNMLSLYTFLGMVPVFTAAGFTDCISPVDHHVGRFIQARMGASYRKTVEEAPDDWLGGDGDEDIMNPQCSAAENRRMLMATWLSEAWTDLITNHSGLINAAFVKTGFKLALDGSDDRLIDIQGWSALEAYSFR